MNKNRIIFLDFLRLLAVLMVVYGHIAQRLNMSGGGFFGLPGIYYVSIGGLGVTFFLILSGMALQISYGERAIEYGRYLITRARRIYPVYWLSIVFSLLMIWLEGEKVIDWNQVAYDITGFQVYSGKSWETFLNSVSWFMGLILVLYIIFPYLSKLFKKRETLILIILFVLSLLSRYLVGKYWHVYRPNDWFFMGRLFEFGLGIWLVKNKHIFKLICSVRLKYLEKPTGFLALLSFPIFLVHFPALRFLADWGLFKYLVIVLGSGYIIYFIDNLMRRTKRRIVKTRLRRKLAIQ